MRFSRLFASAITRTYTVVRNKSTKTNWNFTRWRETGGLIASGWRSNDYRLSSASCFFIFPVTVIPATKSSRNPSAIWPIGVEICPACRASA